MGLGKSQHIEDLVICSEGDESEDNKYSMYANDDQYDIDLSVGINSHQSVDKISP